MPSLISADANKTVSSNSDAILENNNDVAARIRQCVVLASSGCADDDRTSTDANRTPTTASSSLTEQLSRKKNDCLSSPLPTNSVDDVHRSSGRIDPSSSSGHSTVNAVYSPGIGGCSQSLYPNKSSSITTKRAAPSSLLQASPRQRPRLFTDRDSHADSHSSVLSSNDTAGVDDNVTVNHPRTSSIIKLTLPSGKDGSSINDVLFVSLDDRGSSLSRNILAGYESLGYVAIELPPDYDASPSDVIRDTDVGGGIVSRGRDIRASQGVMSFFCASEFQSASIDHASIEGVLASFGLDDETIRQTCFLLDSFAKRVINLYTNKVVALPVISTDEGRSLPVSEDILLRTITVVRKIRQHIDSSKDDMGIRQLYYAVDDLYQHLKQPYEAMKRDIDRLAVGCLGIPTRQLGAVFNPNRLAYGPFDIVTSSCVLSFALSNDNPLGKLICNLCYDHVMKISNLVQNVTAYCAIKCIIYTEDFGEYPKSWHFYSLRFAY